MSIIDLPKHVSFWFDEEYLLKLKGGYEEAFGSSLVGPLITLIIHVESPKWGIKDAAVRFDFADKQVRYKILERKDPDKPKNGVLVSGKPDAWQAAYDARALNAKNLDVKYKIVNSKDESKVKNLIDGFFAAALRVAKEFNYLPA